MLAAENYSLMCTSFSASVFLPFDIVTKHSLQSALPSLFVKYVQIVVISYRLFTSLILGLHLALDGGIRKLCNTHTHVLMKVFK